MIFQDEVTFSEEVLVPRLRLTTQCGAPTYHFLSREVRLSVVTSDGTALGMLQGSAHELHHLVQGWLLGRGLIGHIDDVHSIDIHWLGDEAEDVSYETFTEGQTGKTIHRYHPDTPGRLQPMLTVHNGQIVNHYREQQMKAATPVCPSTTANDPELVNYADAIVTVTIASAATRHTYHPPALPADFQVPLCDILACAPLLDSISEAHHRTHGVHEGAIVQNGVVVAYAEDVGRHNVLDRLFSQIQTQGINPAHTLLVFSGRVPFSVVAKVRYMGFPILLSRTTPTSLGVKLATEQGVTLVNHLRVHRCEVFTHPERIRYPIEE